MAIFFRRPFVNLSLSTVSFYSLVVEVINQYSAGVCQPRHSTRNSYLPSTEWTKLKAQSEDIWLIDGMLYLGIIFISPVWRRRLSPTHDVDLRCANAIFCITTPTSLTSSVASSSRDVSDHRAGCLSARIGMARPTNPQDGLKRPRAAARSSNHPSTGQRPPIPDITSSFAVSTHPSTCVSQYRRSLPAPGSLNGPSNTATFFLYGWRFGHQARAR